MTGVRILLSRVRGLFSGSERLDEEIAGHPERLAADYRSRGRLPFWDTLPRDLGYALRQLRQSPGIAASAVLTLALGIGANAAIYQVLDSVIFRALPVKHAEQLVLVSLMENGKPLRFSYPLYREMAARQNVTAGMMASSNEPLHNAILRGHGAIETVNASIVTGNYFEVLGAAASRGRTFTESDEHAAAPVAVISHAFWQRQFGGAAAIGSTLEINRALVTIVGIMPPAFFGESANNAPDVWVPMSMQPLISPSDWRDAPAFTWLQVTARLRPDVSPARAATVLTALYRQLPTLNVRHTGGTDYQVRLQPANQLLAELNAESAHPLFILIGISAAVLLIACCNLANLLLSRATARRHEIGVRMALGAGRGRVLRQLLTESCLLCLLGTAAAALFAWWGSRVLAAAQGWHVALEPNWRVLGFTGAIAVFSTLLFGLAPAIYATRGELLPALRNNRRTHSSGGGHVFGKLLIAAQISSSLVLLSGALLLGRTLWNLQHQDFGFERGDVLMIDLPVEFGPKMLSRSNALRPALYDRLRALPGVRSAAISACGLMSSWQRTGPLATAERPARQEDNTRFTFVTPHYFETMGIRMVTGRGIDDSDRAGETPVAVLSETAARTLFGTANPVGRLVSGSYTFDEKKASRVIGVAHDVRFGPRDPHTFQIYFPIAQAALPMTEAVIRTSGDPSLLTGAVRAAIRGVDASAAVGTIESLQARIDSGLVHERMMALISSSFGFLALLLTSIGVYGVIAYSVERRTQEIGIRLALGAGGRQVTGLLVRELGLAVAASLALGLAVTAAATRTISTMLYGVAARDVTTLALAPLALAAVALVAAWLPARRAARLDPLEALRQE